MTTGATTSLIKWFVDWKRETSRDNNRWNIPRSSCGAIEKRETNKFSIKRHWTIPNHSLMSRQLLYNHPSKKVVDDDDLSCSSL